MNLVVLGTWPGAHRNSKGGPQKSQRGPGPCCPPQWLSPCCHQNCKPLFSANLCFQCKLTKSGFDYAQPVISHVYKNLNLVTFLILWLPLYHNRHFSIIHISLYQSINVLYDIVSAMFLFILNYTTLTWANWSIFWEKHYCITGNELMKYCHIIHNSLPTGITQIEINN